MLSEVLIKLAQQNQREEREYKPRCSAAGPERCVRADVYFGLGIPAESFSGRFIMLLDDSSWAEELTADWIRKSSFKLHSEQMEVVPFEINGQPVKGHIDGIITDLLGKDYLWENKAINHFTFQRFEGGEIPIDYVTQCCMYLEGLSKVSVDLSEAILLIKNKNTSAYMEFHIRYENGNAYISLNDKEVAVIENIVKQAKEKFEKIDAYIQKKTLPARQYDIDHWRCQYCNWGKHCWKGYGEEFEALTEGADLEQDLKDTVAYYLEVSMRRLEMEKEEKTLRESLKKVMKEKSVRQGRCGEYTLEIKLTERRTLDKSLLPPELVIQATKVSVSESPVKIRKIKKEE